MNLGPYSKTISALVTGLLGWGAVVVTSESAPVTASEWLGLGVVVATALGVYAIPNGPAQVQVVNRPDEPVPVAEDLERAVEEGQNRPLRIDRGAVDVASAVLGFLVALALVVLIATLRDSTY